MLWPLIHASLTDALLESGSSMLTLGFAGTHRAGATIVHFTSAATGLVVVVADRVSADDLFGIQPT